MDDFQMSYRYLFLDIDGVLHSSDAYTGVNNVKAPLHELRGLGLFAHLDLLTSLLAPHQDVSLVVHSSWRQTHDDEQLRMLFGPLAHLVVGATARELDRRLSILESIVRLRIEPAQYRVLDDQPELLDGFESSVIACDSRLGLADLTAQRQLQNWLDTSRQGYG
jgi:hypothetical protein